MLLRIVLVALIIVTLVATVIVHTSPGAILDWSDGSAVLTIQPLSQTVIDGYTVNAVYHGTNQAGRRAEPYPTGQGRSRVLRTRYATGPAPALVNDSIHI